MQRLLQSCFLWCTKQEMTPDDIHDNQTTHVLNYCEHGGVDLMGLKPNP